METVFEQFFRAFNHLAREIQIYVFSGFVIFINALIIDHFYFNSTLLVFIKVNTLAIPAIISLYLLGHFCMAFFYTILEWPKLDKKINRLLRLESFVDSKSLPTIYKQNPGIYIHFIERYVILTMMRWTLSAACFINLIIDLIILFKKDIHWQLLLTTIAFATGAIIFYLLSAKTEKDYAERISSLKAEGQLNNDN